MRPPRIIRSAAAYRDLDQIYRHVAREADLEAAATVLTRITDALYRAAQSPLLYQRHPELRGSPRRINIFRYSVFFEELPEGDGIHVWRVLHGARDIRRILQRTRLPRDGGY